jgi:hypothetical protein
MTQRILQDGLRLFLEGGAIMYMLGGVACLLYASAIAALAYVGQGNLNERTGPLGGVHPRPEPRRTAASARPPLRPPRPRLTIKTVAAASMKSASTSSPPSTAACSCSTPSSPPPRWPAC